MGGMEVVIRCRAEKGEKSSKEGEKRMEKTGNGGAQGMQ